MADISMKPKLREFLINNWFLIAILGTLIGAYSFLTPWIGESSLFSVQASKIAIFLIFLFSGLEISSESLLNSLKNTKLVYISLLFTFIAFPILGYIFGVILVSLGVPNFLVTGFKMATCMPPPASAGIILTSHFQGDEATAITISVIGNALSTIISPLLILFFILNLSIYDFSNFAYSLISLFCLILFPLCIAQIIRSELRARKIECKKTFLSIVSKLMLLYVILCNSCPSLPKSKLNTHSLLSFALIACAIIMIQLVTFALLYYLDRYITLKFHRGVKIAMILCNSMKSMTTGIAIITLIAKEGDNKSDYLVPVLMFEPLQIALATILGAWVFDHLEEIEDESVV